MERMETVTGFHSLLLITILTGNMQSFCLRAIWLQYIMFRLHALGNSKTFKIEFREQNIGKASLLSPIRLNNLNQYIQYEKCVMCWLDLHNPLSVKTGLHDWEFLGLCVAAVSATCATCTMMIPPELCTKWKPPCRSGNHTIVKTKLCVRLVRLRDI